jgi:hypothetical protein
MARITKACAILLLVLAVVQLQYQGETCHAERCGFLTELMTGCACPAYVMLGCAEALKHAVPESKGFDQDMHNVGVAISLSQRAFNLG